MPKCWYCLPTDSEVIGNPFSYLFMFICAFQFFSESMYYFFPIICNKWTQSHTVKKYRFIYFYNLLKTRYIIFIIWFEIRSITQKKGFKLSNIVGNKKGQNGVKLVIQSTGQIRVWLNAWLTANCDRKAEETTVWLRLHQPHQLEKSDYPGRAPQSAKWMSACGKRLRDPTLPFAHFLTRKRNKEYLLRFP